MTDFFGLTQLPVESPGDQDVVSDLLLQRLGMFLQAALNRMGNDAWGSRCPGRDVVAHVFYHNPEELFEQNRLPALYLWESDSAREQAADDVLKDTRTIQIYWITEPGQEEHLVGRAPFRNAVNKAIITALHRERDPAWVVDGDTDALAATQGSFLPSWLGYNSLTRGVAKTLELDAGVDGEGKQNVCYGIATSVVIEELVTWDTDSFTEPAAVTVTINANPSEGDDGPELGWIYEPPD